MIFFAVKDDTVHRPWLNAKLTIAAAAKKLQMEIYCEIRYQYDKCLTAIRYPKLIL